MPPIRMTSVIPTAITPRTVIWSITFRKLRIDRKVSVEKDRNTQRRTRPIRGPVAPRTKAKARPPFVSVAAPVVVIAMLLLLPRVLPSIHRLQCHWINRPRARATACVQPFRSRSRSSGARVGLNVLPPRSRRDRPSIVKRPALTPASWATPMAESSATSVRSTGTPTMSASNCISWSLRVGPPSTSKRSTGAPLARTASRTSAI